MQNLTAMTPEQIPACAALMVSAYAAPPWSEGYETAEIMGYLEKFLHHPDRIALVWTEDQCVCGLALGIRIPWMEADYLHLEDFCTWPQKQGIGSRFLAALKEYVRSHGMNSIILGTVRDFPACSFYQKNHFQLLKDSVSLYCPLIEEGKEL